MGNELFKSMMQKRVSWFDSKDKAPGILVNIFTEDIANLNGLTTENFCMILETILCIISGIAGSAYYDWRMALICILSLPFNMIGTFLISRL